MAEPETLATREAGESIRSENQKKKRKHKKLVVGMSALFDTSDRIPPVVGYFSSGYNPDAGEGEPEVRAFRDARHQSSRMDIVVRPEGESSKVEFVGTSYTDANAQHNPCSYALGVLDKDTGTLKIVPIAANKIFRLEPRVIKSPSADVEPSEGLVEEGRKKEDLIELYGTKKQKNMDKRYSSLKQLAGAASAGEHLDFTNDINDEALKEADKTALQNIPPHDPSAVTPEKVYLLEEIILKSERNYLFDILEILQAGFGEKTKFWEENHYPNFVINRLHKLRAIQGEEEKEKLACILSYITHLVNFWKLVGSVSRFKSSRPISNISVDALNKYKIPRVVCQRFMKMFVDTELNVVPTEKRELIIGYILVLTLFADGFRTDSSDIEKDLVGITNMKLYYLQLGCKCVRGYWTLPAPLNLLTIRKRRGKKQQR